jgi:hypothetical protein
MPVVKSGSREYKSVLYATGNAESVYQVRPDLLGLVRIHNRQDIINIK